MQTMIRPQERQAAKRQIIEDIEQGTSAQEARARSAVHMHPATVYRLLKRVRAGDETTFTDGRHGHPIKLRGEVRTFLIEMCQTTPLVSSPLVQQAIQERFGLSISVSQLNRVRASPGLSRRSRQREKKSSLPRSSESEWQESAGSLLLLAAATETSLLAQFSQALPPEIIQPGSSRLPGGLSTCHRLLLILLFLGAVELRRTWDLRSYAGDGLAC